MDVTSYGYNCEEWRGSKISTYPHKSFWNSSQEDVRKGTTPSWLTDGVYNSGTLMAGDSSRGVSLSVTHLFSVSPFMPVCLCPSQDNTRHLGEP